MKRDFIFILALLFFQGYGILPSSAWSALPPAPVKYNRAAAYAPTPFATATPSLIYELPTATATPLFTATPTVEPTFTPVPEPYADVERVLIVSFDGMRPDAVAAAGMENLLALIGQGAYTLSARTIIYPATLPGHSSMLSGMCMQKHGVNWNSNNRYRGYAQGTDIFELTAAAGMKSMMIVGKDKLRLIAEPETTDVFEVRNNEAEIAQTARDLMAEDFDLMFVHFPSADLRGHKFGWMSNSYLKALRDGDEALGVLLNGLAENNLLDSTLIIVTADHGGHDTTHDGSLDVDFLIPWVVVGPGIVPGELNNSVAIMDTAATAAYALGLSIPPEWDGLPSYEAFGLPAQDVHYNIGACE